jgi:hypothetical protein
MTWSIRARLTALVAGATAVSSFKIVWRSIDWTARSGA